MSKVSTLLSSEANLSCRSLMEDWMRFSVRRVETSKVSEWSADARPVAGASSCFGAPSGETRCFGMAREGSV